MWFGQTGLDVSRNQTRRMFFSALGSASFASIAGCSLGSESQPSATESLSLESGTIETTSLSDIASIIPQVDPLVMSAWKSPEGLSVMDPAEYEEPEDTLRYNTVNGRLAPTAMAAYLLSRENAPLVGPLWLGYLENNVSAEWTAVIAGVSVMYSSDIDISTLRTTAESVDVEYETVTDTDSAVIFQGSNGAVVGVTSNVFAFVPAIDDSLPFAPVNRVTALIETAAGNRESLPSQDSLLKPTLRHARVQGIVQLTHSQNAPLGDALPDHQQRMNGAAFSVTGDTTGYEAAQIAVCQLDGVQEAPVSATATIGFPDGKDVDEGTLIESVGNLGEERTYVQDENIVRVGCEYPKDALSAVLDDSSLGT